MASDMYHANFDVHLRPNPTFLISNVLSRKNSGLDLPRNIDIPELINPSEYSHPEDFPGIYDFHEERYFFTKPTRVDQSHGKCIATMRRKSGQNIPSSSGAKGSSSGNKKMKRSMRDGYWKSHKGKEEIWKENGNLIGHMGSYSFKRREGKDTPSWLMKELSDLDSGSSSGADRWVLWVIYRKGSKCSTLLSVPRTSTTINRGITGPTQEVGIGTFPSQNENMSDASHLDQFQITRPAQEVFPPVSLENLNMPNAYHQHQIQIPSMLPTMNEDENHTDSSSAYDQIDPSYKDCDMNVLTMPNVSHQHQIQIPSMLPTMIQSPIMNEDENYIYSSSLGEFDQSYENFDMNFLTMPNAYHQHQIQTPSMLPTMIRSPIINEDGSCIYCDKNSESWVYEEAAWVIRDLEYLNLNQNYTPNLTGNEFSMPCDSNQDI